jgi:hypothetical protein
LSGGKNGDNRPRWSFWAGRRRWQEDRKLSFAKAVHRANVLASLENINRAIIKRRLKGPGF